MHTRLYCQIFLGLLIAAIFTTEFSSTASAQDRTLTVLASGSSSAVADHVTLALTVSSGDVTATGLFVRQNDVVARLKKALEGAGIAAQDITEQPFHLTPNYEYGQNGTRIIGYRIDTPLEVTLDHVDDLARMIDLATASGASQIAVGSFSSGGGYSLHGEAVKAAIANARKEAAGIAKEMGKTLGDIVSVSETEDAAKAAPAGRGEEEERRESRATAPQPNTMSEKAELKVVFELK
ncbi:MAG: SIMPL domain-containing protein [Bacteroidota bacterium]|nr:SIMPL domain-containing protein [Bacteroidota bacterium]MDP4232057.1 SIMPL domain-containing protein [Bacteroidota bacterium]MDP4241236.1 SIMPL domain-containing protein [Bacteroidota bacterium]MDP4286628.1 SIMPL domain-containing protein [Bacteroidota bacterium]